MAVRVVILGSGYAGCAAAVALDRAAREGRVEVTVVSPEAVLVRTPLLAAAAAGRIRIERTCLALHALAPSARHVPGRAVSADPVAKTVAVRCTVNGGVRELPYDHLVVAVGGLSEDRRVGGAATNCRTLRTPADAAALRNRVLECLASACRAGTGTERDALTTVVVVGGGSAGVGAAGAIADLHRRAVQAWAPALSAHTRVVLAELKPRLLSNSDHALGRAAADSLSRKGVEIVTGDAVTDVSAATVACKSSRTVPSATCVWTAGVRALPLVEGLLPGAEVSTGGRLAVSPNLEARGVADVWAAGDAASVPDLLEGGEAPATAAFAAAAGRRIGRNILRVLEGEFPVSLRFAPRLQVVPLGHGTVGRIRARTTTHLPASLADTELFTGHGAALAAWAKARAGAGGPCPLPLETSEVMATAAVGSVPVSFGQKPAAVAVNPPT